MLREHGVERVVACDYELTGVLEVLAPDIHVVHGWGAASQRRSDVLPSLIRRASGGHFLVLDASAPMIYNQTPSEGQMMALALELGLVARKVATLGSATALYEVSEKQSALREVHPKR